MNHGQTDDLKTSVGELANLMNDTFTCCIRNYEALLPYLEKKETELKIYHRLVQINILLNKLNEELVGLRVEFVTVSSYERKKVTFLPECGKKRKTPDVVELDSHVTKNVKTEVLVCSTALSLNNGVNNQSENVTSMDTKETRKSQVLKLDGYSAQNIKTEAEDSDEVEHASAAIHFAGDEESTPVTDRIVVDTTDGAQIDTVTQRESHEEYIPLQNIMRQTTAKENCENDGHVLCEDSEDCREPKSGADCTITSSCQMEQSFSNRESPVAATTCNLESATLLEERTKSCNKRERRANISPVRHEKKQQWDNIIYKNGKWKCVLCSHKLPGKYAVKDHVNGWRHKQNEMDFVPSRSASKSKVPLNNCDGKSSASHCAGATCSLAANATIVEDRSQLASMKHAITLSDMWKCFAGRFRFNEKYVRIHSGQVICSLCNLRLGRCTFSVKKHIVRPCHLRRIKRLKNIEVRFKTSNEQLLSIPGILKNIIPKTQFLFEKNGVFCRVCDSLSTNEAVLSHMTSKSHAKKLSLKKNEK